MSGLTFCVTYEPDVDETDVMTRIRSRRHDHFVASTWPIARALAAGGKRPGEKIAELKIGEPQRLLDPELDHTKMRVEDGIFLVDWGEVCDLANDKDIPADLSADEMRVFLKCIESGLSCWREVVELALRAATSERSGS